MLVSDPETVLAEARAAAKAKVAERDRKVEERKQPEVMKVLQMAAVAAKKVKWMSGCSAEADHSLFCLFSNKKRPIKRLHV